MLFENVYEGLYILVSGFKESFEILIISGRTNRSVRDYFRHTAL
jgi:hypothetical protein